MPTLAQAQADYTAAAERLKAAVEHHRNARQAESSAREHEDSSRRELAAAAKVLRDATLAAVDDFATRQALKEAWAEERT